MSLSVPSHITERLDRGEEVSELEFGSIVEQSLPAAWALFEKIRTELNEGLPEMRVSKSLVNLKDFERGQVLRAMASDAIRRFVYGWFSVCFSMPNENHLEGVRSFEDQPTRDLSPAAAQANHEAVCEAYKDLIRRFPLGAEVIARVGRNASSPENEFYDYAPAHMDPNQRLQLLTVMAVEPYRKACEHFWGVKLAFQNCHRAGGGKDPSKEVFRVFVSLTAQLMNQQPGMVDC